MDFEAVETSVRSGMHHVGAVVLETLINSDGGGHTGTPPNCCCGHRMEFVGYRDKTVVSIVGHLKVKRAYYTCGGCHKGIIPKDQHMDVVGTHLSSGVRRMMARVGAKESFDEGKRDLKELAGIVVTTKEVERVSEETGEKIETDFRRQPLPDNVVALVPKDACFYIGMDGTGIPVVRRETQGRKGKGEDGVAKTREAKLGVVFTQTTVDKDGNAVRDENSTTYVGAIENSEAFGKRVQAEAQRRGVFRAKKVVVLGDAAAWIWNESKEQFPEAIQIVDFFHAMEHLSDLSKVMHESKIIADLWLDMQRATLWNVDGGSDMVIESMQRMNPSNHEAKKILSSTIHYFEANQMRMRYKEYRDQGLFVGSGVVEAGCKTIIGQRLKQSGMHWTVKGANAIISLRCCQKSGQWEDYWANRVAA